MYTIDPRTAAGAEPRPSAARRLRRLRLVGPAFVAAIAYVDPGNVATNVTAGVRYGYLLVWVVVAANLMACLVQYLSAKLGLVTGQSLPEALRDRMPRAGRLAYWAQAELVAVATDLAEVLGGAIALYLLFDLPLLVGGLITG
ncbi:Nramp family divalent metal transporter, partial [Streptomyces albiflaviniger]|nr:Nramp family divalent metal transporter [Streptomyces albiflaviniger]